MLHYNLDACTINFLHHSYNCKKCVAVYIIILISLNIRLVIVISLSREKYISYRKVLVFTHQYTSNNHQVYSKCNVFHNFLPQLYTCTCDTHHRVTVMFYSPVHTTHNCNACAYILFQMLLDAQEHWSMH